MKLRGNLRAGAERISETILRSTSAFVPGAVLVATVVAERVSSCPVTTGDAGGAVGTLFVSVTIRTATCAASSPWRATRSATRNPFARRLHIRAAGIRRRFAKVVASRHGGLRPTASSTGGGGLSG